MNALERFGREAVFRVAERPGMPSDGIKTLIAEEEVGVDASLLLTFCFKQPTPFTYDLMTVVAAVRCADRACIRKHSEAWARRLTVEVPVFDTALWRSEKTQSLLTQTLSYLTGDEWEFNFKARRRRFKPHHEAPLALGNASRFRFIPYSHGLDSFAQLRLLQTKEPEVQHICVHADTRHAMGGWAAFCRRSKGQHVQPLRVPLRFNDPHHAEVTFRSRPFIYYTLTAYGAVMADCSEVAIPENGQGSVGGSLAPLGQEAPHRSCHPAFTDRLSKLLGHLTGKVVTFKHPGLFSTKGDVLRDLVAVEGDGAKWLPQHWSCSHDQRNATSGAKRIHCGVCGNCILRRNAAVAAGIRDETQYLYDDLSQPTMDASLMKGAPRPRSFKAFEDLASNGVRSMTRLADLAANPDSLALWSESANLAEALSEPVAQVHDNLTSFVQRHAVQWQEFLTQCGPNSWVSSMARE